MADDRRLSTAVRRLTMVVERYGDDIEGLRDEQKTQFRRLSQIQGELDAIKNTGEEMKGIK